MKSPFCTTLFITARSRAPAMNLPVALPSPSPLLEASRIRWVDRSLLVHREIDILLEGLSAKSHFLGSLREKIKEHRRDDAAQLTAAQTEAIGRWEERLTRLVEWQASADALVAPSNMLMAWRENARWFDRAQSLSERFSVSLARSVERLEKRYAAAAERMQKWSGRLAVMEGDLAELMAGQVDKTGDIFISEARKRPYLDFVFLEREEEGFLAVELKNISAEVARSLARIGRVDQWMAKKADINSAYFEIRKNQLFNSWRPFQARLIDISQQTLNLGLPFDDSRHRLRGIYDIVHRMRVVQKTPPPQRRPLLHRLFNIQDD